MNAPTEQQIEQMLRSSRFDVPAEIESHILHKATHVKGDHIKGDSPLYIKGAVPFSRVWRRVAVLFLCLGAIAIVVAYLSRPGITLAEVAAAYAKQTWVHIKYDNDREEWTSVVDGRRFFKDHDGRSVYTELNGLRLWYWPKGTYISKDKWFTGDRAPAEHASETPWNQFVDPYEKQADKQANKKSASVERHDDTLDGRNVVRFDCYMTDALNQRLLIRQIWADPKTELPVQDREVLQLAEREEQKREAIVGRYDFPSTGPTRLEDIGVPAGLVVIDSEAKPADDVAEILAKAKAARERWPATYRLIAWEPEQIWAEVDRIYVDGKKHAMTRWAGFPVKGLPELPKPPIKLEHILSWLDTRTPMHRTIADGVRKFSRRDNVINDPKDPPAVTRVLPDTMNFDDVNYPPGFLWFYTGVLKKVDAPEPGIVLLRSEHGDDRSDYHIDTAHDFICVRYARLKRDVASGEWKHDHAWSLSDLKPLPNGSWYATRRTRESYGPRFEKNGKPQLSFDAYDVTILKPDEIPAGTFDGEKLLDGAKVETF